MRAKNEIEEMWGDAQDWVIASQTEFTSMTYEEGVAAALSWVLMETDEEPIERKFFEEE